MSRPPTNTDLLVGDDGESSKMSDRVLAARWTNMMLRPPTDALGRLIFAMAQDRGLCDEFTENFNYPERQWDRLASDARIHAWIDSRAPVAA